VIGHDDGASRREETADRVREHVQYQDVSSISKNQVDIEESRLYVPDAEMRYLALLMKMPHLITEGSRQVKKDAMFFEINRYAYGIMIWIYEEAERRGWNLNFDPPSMFAAARYMGPQYERNFHEKTNGMERLRDIELMVPHVHETHFEALVHQINDHAKRVAIHRKGRQLMLAATDFARNANAGAIAKDASGWMMDLAFSGVGGNDDRILKISECEVEVLRETRISHANPEKGLSFLRLDGFPVLMNHLGGGLKRRGLIVCTARPKTGKSTLALHFSIQAAVSQNVPTLYLDSEMSRKEMYSRSLSNISKLQENEILMGKVYDSRQNADEMWKAVDRLKQSPFYYVNVAGRGPAEIASLIRQFRTQCVGTQVVTDPLDNKQYVYSNRGLVIYDWLKLSSATELKNAQEHQMLGFLTSALKDAANFNDLPIFALGQNNREAAKAKKSSDWEDNADTFVAGTDRIAHFCTALMTLRNVTREEAKQIPQRKQEGPVEEKDKAHGEGHLDANNLVFNQVLHLLLNRSGPSLRSGIPLYIHRGMSSYEEMVGENGKGFELLRSLKAKAAAKDSKPEGMPPQTQTKHGAPTDREVPLV
jgi:replicative DNA helicase